jgi:hypothetical protein
MKPKFPFVRPRSYPNSFVLAVRQRGAHTRRPQRAFFGALHWEARHQGLVMGHKLGLCVFFGAVSRLVAFASLFAADPKANALIRAACGTLVQRAAHLGGRL